MGSTDPIQASPIHTRSLRPHGRIGLEGVRWKSASRNSQEGVGYAPSRLGVVRAILTALDKSLRELADAIERAESG